MRFCKIAGVLPTQSWYVSKSSNDALENLHAFYRAAKARQDLIASQLAQLMLSKISYQ